MTRYLTFFLASAVLTGCAPRHYVLVQAETVTLYLQAPEAAKVQFASSVDQFTLRDVSKNEEGAWIVNGLNNKEFQYFYIVDGAMFVPDCRFHQNDDFGTVNCRYLP